MITGHHHVEMNGVKYRLAESAEGEHYVEAGEPLRPPNSQTVQGPSSSVFQMRPDTLTWLIDNWAGGEGIIRYNLEEPSRHRILHNVDPFYRPGALRPGWYIENNIDVGSTFVFECGPAISLNAPGKHVFMIADDTGDNTIRVYYWNPSTAAWTLQFDSGIPAAAVTLAGRAYPCAALGGFVFAYRNTAANLQYYAWIDPVAATLNNIYNVSTGVDPDILNLSPISLGDYLYGRYGAAQNSIFEVTVSGTGFTTFYEGGPDEQIEELVQGDNRGYALVRSEDSTKILEIVPTTAAGTGYVTQIARIPGIRPRDGWYAGGMLFFSTKGGDIYYLRPGGEYGILYTPGPPTEGRGTGQRFAGPFAGLAQSTFFTGEDGVVGGDEFSNVSIYKVDLISGAYARICTEADTATTWQTPRTLAAFDASEASWGSDEALIFRYDNSGGKRAAVIHDQFTNDNFSRFLSGWWNFGVLEEKQLLSIRITHEMSSNWNIWVLVRKDGDDDNPVLLDTVAGTDGNTVTTIIPSAEFSFTELGVEIWFGAANSTAITEVPYIFSIEVRATVVQPQRVWQLILDLADDATGVSPSVSGKTKIANVQALADAGAPFTFKNGYRSRAVGDFETITAVLDSYQISLDRPGEGVATVILREVS